MGRVFKKKAGSKREAEEEKQEELVTKKKSKEEQKPEPEQEEEEEENDEDVTDEEDDAVDDEENSEDDGDNIMDFDFEAYPPSDDDRDGIVNMLTQTFLRTDIDLKAMSEVIIANAPHGIVLTQAYDDEETEEDYMAYGLCTTLALNEKKEDAPKFIKDIFAYILNRAKKVAPSEVYKKIEEIQDAGDGKAALFVNERLLNFPTIVVPQIFESIRSDIAGFETKYKSIIYIQKLRVVENDETSGNESKAGSSSSGPAAKKKGKIGKAEKKRAAAAALANAEIEFDNPEDRVLYELKHGNEVHFDFPVHMDVEPGSKFHCIEKEGKKWNPFRRIVIMDDKRFEAFLKRGSEGVIV